MTAAWPRATAMAMVKVSYKIGQEIEIVWVTIESDVQPQEDKVAMRAFICLDECHLGLTSRDLFGDLAT
jgi:hypothetical protein